MNTLSSIIKWHAIIISWHVVNHSKNLWSHIQKHHKKYLFWLVWWAILVKVIALIFAWIWIGYTINNDTFADNEWEYCYLTWQSLTWGYETWCYLTWEYLTQWTMTGCYMEWQYLTWWSLDESWNLIWQYLEWGYLTGCSMEWQELTWGYLEWCHMEWQELTWGYMTCESTSGSLASWSNSNQNNNSGSNLSSCSYSGFNLISLSSWLIVWWDISLNRQYCPQNNSNIIVQLLDHNKQRINISSVASTASWTKFNSKLLSTWYTLSWVNYWMYHIIAQNTSWENYYTFTGNYTWNYTDYATGYQIRFVQNSNVLYSSDYTFTIDNASPTVSLISFNLTPIYTWKIYINSLAEIIVQSSEALSGVSFMLNNYAWWVTVTQSWNIYKIHQILSSNNASGLISYTLQYYDLASNVWTYSNASNIIFLPTNFTTGTTTTWINNTWTITTTTWTKTVNSSGGLWLIKEISKFNACRKLVSYKELKLNIHNSTYVLQMPDFKKSYVKKIINAFTLVVLSDIEKNNTLTNTDLQSITNKFNNFLIILKLVRDDDNSCKQSLSNYHITEFKKAMLQYDLYSD